MVNTKPDERILKNFENNRAIENNFLQEYFSAVETIARESYLDPDKKNWELKEMTVGNSGIGVTFEKAGNTNEAFPYVEPEWYIVTWEEISEYIRKISFDIQKRMYPENHLPEDKTLSAAIEHVSDGYHTFKELYDCRMVLNAAFFNLLHRMDNPGMLCDRIYKVHKSWKHNDGEECFGGGWFIVGALLPEEPENDVGDRRQISFHYPAQDWDLFKIPELQRAAFKFDGHTTEDVVKRIEQFIKIL